MSLYRRQWDNVDNDTGIDHSSTQQHNHTTTFSSRTLLPTPNFLPVFVRADRSSCCIPMCGVAGMELCKHICDGDKVVNHSATPEHVQQLRSGCLQLERSGWESCKSVFTTSTSVCFVVTTKLGRQRRQGNARECMSFYEARVGLCPTPRNGNYPRLISISSLTRAYGMSARANSTSTSIAQIWSRD